MTFLVDLLRRMFRHPVMHFTLALLFSPIVAIAGEAFGGQQWLTAGGAVSCALIGVTGKRAFDHERRSWAKATFPKKHVVAIGLVTLFAAIGAVLLTAVSLKLAMGV